MKAFLGFMDWLISIPLGCGPSDIDEELRAFEDSKFKSGGYTPKDSGHQSRFVHRGEMVIPANKVKEFGAMFAGGHSGNEK